MVATSGASTYMTLVSEKRPLPKRRVMMRHTASVLGHRAPMVIP